MKSFILRLTFLLAVFTFTVLSQEVQPGNDPREQEFDRTSDDIERAVILNMIVFRYQTCIMI